MARLSSDRQKWAQQSQRLAHYGRHDLTLASHGGPINWRRGEEEKARRRKEEGKERRRKGAQRKKKQMKSRRGGEDGKGKTKTRRSRASGQAKKPSQLLESDAFNGSSSRRGQSIGAIGCQE
ncbi:hypothetical protein M431DRAFT_504735 [Trichoderma harzianum CBS 226.95]|uniref:Uncharacterized protein n=1 Tax=Trichoderma harzianum CBS 226.95 TaxID=983964 RepID=A0A2T4ARS7_TRIHA|nr:hypothetical protein M431DRAFT_504735 [Trichoderma harzianum CBS 226.95]PTB59776.1 hypothetical protein M431DRAFT_504735 [Trichoderma harzianum CBS 226.95]